MAQIITSRWWGWGGWCSQWGCISWTLCDQADLQSALNCKADCSAIPTNNCQLANGCWYAKSCDLPDFSCYQTKANMVCNLCNADNSHYPSAKAVSDAITASWGWDMLKSVYDPNNCSTDAFNYNNMYNKLTAWANIDITNNVVAATNNYIVTEDKVSVSTTPTKWVAPYSTSYCYTNIDIDAASGIQWKEWAVYTFDIDTEMVVASAYRNVRVKIWNGDYIPVMWTSSILAWCAYFTKANTRQYMYSTKYQSCWALHLFTDSNTTYSAMTNAEATTWTCTTWRSIAACTLKCAINTFAPISSSAYGSGWCGSNSAPTQDAVYAKVSTIDAVIPSAATCSNQLADKNYVNDSINSVTAYYITKNAAGDQFATHSELVNAGTYYSWWAVRVPTRNDYAIVLDDETHDDEVTRYIYNNGWEYQYTINESPLTQAQLDALNSWITAAKVTHYDTIPTITDNCQIANGCGYTTCTGTISTCSQIISTLWYTPYNSTNPNWYTTCTGTVSSCADVIWALWYTPYNSTNPSWYTTCTWTLVAWDLTVVSWDTWCVYTIKKSTTAPSWAGSNTITLVVE